MKTKPPCRLFVILAREAPVGVILRRGPSNWVRLIKWHTDTDKMESGHWFHGRIYEKRCDLSPDGNLLIYFARKITGRTLADREYTYAWTAISRPPWLTALALWPKGDCWHGGGLFQDNKTVWLNHRPAVAKPHRDHQPHGLKVIPNPDACGEDSPIYDMRLQRDGWYLRQEMEYHEISYGFATDRPEVWSKRHPELKVNLLMENSFRKFSIVSSYSLEDRETREKHPVVGATWADWDQQGRLVFAGNGCMFVAELLEPGHIDPVQIADFNNDEPAEITPPEWARTW